MTGARGGTDPKGRREIGGTRSAGAARSGGRAERHAEVRLLPPVGAGGVGLSPRLPTPISSFIGRKSDMAHVASLLGISRLVTLIGPFGVGKTRLALQVARGRAGAAEDQDGAAFVDVAAVRRRSRLVPALAEALGVSCGDDNVELRDVVSVLRRHRLLVVLDGCEHLVEESAKVAGALLSGCPGVSVLATSRQPLRLAGERVCRVLPLPVPGTEPTEGAGGEADPASDSVRLFLARAEERTHAPIGARQLATVSEICWRLEGIPLAIELAAARTGMFTAAEILVRLQDPLGFLTRGSRAAPARHRSLVATLDWSYGRLSPAEQALFRRLSVFSGGFDAEAAEGVCTGDEPFRGPVLELLEELVDTSLVVPTPSGEDRSRYALPGLVGHYAAEKLNAAGEEVATRARHAAWHVSVAEQIERDLAGPAQQSAVERVVSEYENLRSALEWTLESDAVLGLRLASALVDFWRIRGRSAEGRRWVERALSAAGDNAPPPLRASALAGISLLATIAGELDAAVAAGEDAARLAEDAGDDATGARALTALGFACTFSHPDRAVPLLERGVALGRRTLDLVVLADALVGLGRARMLVGEVAAAHAAFTESLALARSTGNVRATVAALVGIGWSGSSGAGLSAAARALDEATALAGQLGQRYEHAEALCLLGDLGRVQGRRSEARQLSEDALALARATGSAILTARALRGLGALETAERRPGAARPLLEEAVELARSAGAAYLLVRALDGLAQICQGSGDAGTARALSDEALEVARQSGDRQGLAHWLQVRAGLARAQGDDERASRLQHEALALCAEVGDEAQAALSLVELGGLASASGRYVTAARLFGAAGAVAASVGRSEAFLRTCRWYRKDLALVYEELSAEQLEQALAEGESMSLKDAASYVSRRRGPRGERPSRGWVSLTPSERAVVDLVVQGLTNREVADILFVSPRTVATHVSHTFAKLGVTSRKELARLASSVQD